MVNLDYSDPINDDDIIGWKSDRGWVYLTLLGVRAPKNRVPQQKYRGSVRKIVIDDFDESTQLAVLINKPVLGYDIINSKTSPSTVIFIHTEMKKSEVANLKKHIDEEGVSVFNVAKTSGFPKYNTNFRSAFDKARKELGPNSIFEYHGKLYTTNHPGEKGSESNSLLVSRSKDNFEKLSLMDEFGKKSVIDKEIYIDKTSGDYLSEALNSSDSLETFLLSEEKLKKTPKINKISSEKTPEGDQFLIEKEFKIEKPSPLVASIEDKKPGLINRIFNRYLRKNVPKDDVPTKEKLPHLALKNNRKSKSSKFQKRNIELQEKYIPSISSNLRMDAKDSLLMNLSSTQESDTNRIDPWLNSADIEEFQKRNIELQKKYIPELSSNSFNEILKIEENKSNTQLADTNIVEAWFKDDSYISDEYDATRLQKKYVPRFFDNIELDTTRFTSFNGAPTQLADTNIVEAWFKDDSYISDEYDATRLQKKYVPRFFDNIELDTTRFTSFNGAPTQLADTNIVEAWFKDDSYISDEYDATRLQKKYVPKNMNVESFNKKDSSKYFLSMPQKPEFTDPEVLDNRFKTRFKNNNLSASSKKQDEKPFKKEKDQNTWLSFFPFQSDSVKTSLSWEFRKEKEVPNFLQTERESLNYSSNDNEQYHWKDRIGVMRPETMARRQNDPGFMYYNNSGINVEANIDGVPIYIDGKYVGETPLKRPVQVEPGWHQVSGFSPVYTQLASNKGLQYVGYDPIIENNKLYGATTVYTEGGKMETVELRFNQMGDTPKKWKEVSGGMNIGIPMILFIFGMMTWGMG